VVVLANSCHAERLRELQKVHHEISWYEVGNDIEHLINQVNNGDVEYAVINSIDAASHKRFFPELRVGFDLTTEEPLAWAFSLNGDGSLVAAANEYIAKVKKDGTLEQLEHKYFAHINQLDYVSTRTFLRDVESRLPRLKEIFYTAAARYEIEWQLLAAMSYQESHWKDNAVSPTGVRGLMMLTQMTASDLGVKDRDDPEESIMGGTEYFDSLKKRLSKSIQEPDRTWMALAAYNVGLGHLEDARKLTQSRKKNPNLWSDVRETLPLLSQQKWHSKTRHGYARGHEPVQYVRNIRNFYEILLWNEQQQSPTTLEADSQDIRIEFSPQNKEL
jgi:membrane-bound lytic murein transglycosylase F